MQSASLSLHYLGSGRKQEAEHNHSNFAPGVAGLLIKSRQIAQDENNGTYRIRTAGVAGEEDRE